MKDLWITLRGTRTITRMKFGLLAANIRTITRSRHGLLAAQRG